MPSQDNGDEDPGIFAIVLKAAREHAGLTQKQLADLIGYAEATVTSFERGKRLPTRDGAARIDGALHTNVFTVLREKVVRGSHTVFMQPWLGDEEEAAVLRASEPQFIHGLLQTPAYAEAQIRITRPVYSDTRIAEAVAARVRRQEILDREEPPPPLLRVIQGEAALRRNIGGKEVMRVQLDHLLEMADRPRITLQAVESDKEQQAGLFGSITIASFTGSPDTAFLDTVMSGDYVSDAGATQLNVLYDRVLQEASSPEDTKKLITKLRDELWT